MLIRKELSGQVTFWRNGNLFATLDEVATFALNWQRGGIEIVDQYGIKILIETTQITQTQILPSATIAFAGTVGQLWTLLVDGFFTELHKTNGTGGGGTSFGNVVIVADKNDFPTPIAGVITLDTDTAYFIAGHVDLTGDRLVCSGINTIFGASSETSSLTSTGLSTSDWLLTTTYTLAMQFVTFKDVQKGISITGGTTAALDWTGVNFVNVPQSVALKGCDNFVFTKGAFLNSGGFVVDDTVGTVAFNNSLFSASSGKIIEFLATAIVARRFRIIYSSFIASGTATGVDVSISATIPTESYILDTVNFSGAGTYLAGVGTSSNTSLFVNCKGIVNTAVNGQMYMRNNATATAIASTALFYKVAGTTAASVDNAKYTHSSNRLTNDAIISRKFLIICSLSFDSGTGNVCEFGFYDSKLAAVRTPSITKATANASGRAENVTFQCVVEHSQGDYLEIHCKNTSSTTSITVTDLNVTVTQIN